MMMGHHAENLSSDAWRRNFLDDYPDQYLGVFLGWVGQKSIPPWKAWQGECLACRFESQSVGTEEDPNCHGNFAAIALYPTAELLPASRRDPKLGEWRYDMPFLHC